MQLHPEDYEIKRGLNRFSRLGTWYILALSIIASVAILGQILIQSHLQAQLSDSRVVNVAGKQRMLSQRIAKAALTLREEQSTAERASILQEMRESFSLWRISQRGLQLGNDSLLLPGQNTPEIMDLFAEVEDDFEEMSSAVVALIAAMDSNVDVSHDALRSHIEKILRHEKPFLSGMERIVNQYDEHAKAKVASLRTMEYMILAAAILVMALEVVFIFRPTTRQVNHTMGKLIASEKNARKLSREIGALYSSLEKTYEQMAIVNQPVENPRLLAKADQGGNVIFVSEPFAEVSGVHTRGSATRLSDLFPGMNDTDDWMDNVVDTVSEGKVWQGELKFRKANQEEGWFDTVIVPIYNEREVIEELVMLGSDISSRKAAEQNMNQKNRAEIEKKINQQKFRSVLILEGQEEERKRIAMDIHDGIGQMLTSLKYQIESIDLKETAKANEKISEIDQLIKEIIREVRKVTFNLKPTVLGDYGLQAGLNVFIQEIGKVTDTALHYRTSGAIPRLPQKIENNIFRIIQEAINNAIKYSGADEITVSLKQSENELVLTVQDTGKGFDTRIVGARSSNLESGRGLFNMYERTEYVNGKLEIESERGRGTTVRLTVPLRSAATTE